MALDFWPRAAQQKMRDHALYHNRCNIWADPGVGKTGGTYTAIDLLKLLGSQFFPWLVLAPKQVAVDVWPREQRKWNQFRDLRVVCLAGREDAFDRIEQLRRPADIYVINYDLVQWLVDYFTEKGRTWPFKGVVADESTRLKGFRLRGGAKRAMALARMQKYAGRWINLTGTPSPNGYLDLWGQCWFLDRGERLGRTFGDYQRTYFVENAYTGQWELKPGAEQQIQNKLADITLALRAQDYFDLPPLHKTIIPVQLSPKAREHYNRMEREMFAEIEGKSAEAINSATVTMKCLQMASGAVYTNQENRKEFVEFDEAKLVALDSLLNDMAGNPLLVVYHWRFDKERIMRRFPFAREIKSSESIDEWNAGRIKLGLAYPGSVGHGIDLAKGGNHLCFYSHWWNLEHHDQIIERLGPTRQAQHGLNRPVFLHYIVAEDTLDEDVLARLEGKRTMQEALLARMKK